MFLVWLFAFVFSVALLLLGTHWFLFSAEKIGQVLRLPKFLIGTFLVGFGTSLPELATSLAGVMQGYLNIPTANAIGSNITNILLVVGLIALLSRVLTTSKELIDIDIPLLVGSTFLIIAITYDGLVTKFEGWLLFLGLLGYIFYVWQTRTTFKNGEKEKLKTIHILASLFGLFLIFLSSKYVILSLENLAKILKIGIGPLVSVVLAFSTSLPELAVSLLALFYRKGDISLGNIFGSNMFNVLGVIGIPALFFNLTVDHQVLTIGLPALLLATLFFSFSTISKKIYRWEGIFYLLLYILFVSKLLFPNF